MIKFTPNQIADELTREFGLDLPKTVVRKLISHHFKYIFKAIKTKSDRIKLRNNDIHTIYKEINVKEICGKVADLDETKVPKREKNFAIKNKAWKDPMKSQKKFAKRVWRYKIPKLDA